MQKNVLVRQKQEIRNRKKKKRGKGSQLAVVDERGVCLQNGAFLVSG
jgi:hypothetical protein